MLTASRRRVRIPRGSGLRLLKPGTTLYVMRRRIKIPLYVSMFLPRRIYEAVARARSVANLVDGYAWIEHRDHPAHVELSDDARRMERASC